MSEPIVRRYLVTRVSPNSYVNKYVDYCRNCGGSGIYDLVTAVEMCPVCNGTGYVDITKVIDVIIKPYKTK